MKVVFFRQKFCAIFGTDTGETQACLDFLKQEASSFDEKCERVCQAVELCPAPTFGGVATDATCTNCKTVMQKFSNEVS